MTSVLARPIEILYIVDSSGKITGKNGDTVPSEHHTAPEDRIPVAILGATGMVGQRFVSILARHPWFEITCMAASAQSAGALYEEATRNRWTFSEPIPPSVRSLKMLDVETDLPAIAKQAAMAFSAVSMDKVKIRSFENQCAEMGLAVISNNSAHRWTNDVPMIIPEINADHVRMIDWQRQKHGWTSGCIAVKPNCSIQSYVPVIHALRQFEPEQVVVSTYQAVSGAGNTLDSWPEMRDNVSPYIAGEEEKSEQEPLKIWGKLEDGKLIPAEKPVISSTCVRVPVTDGHMASISMAFAQNPTRDQIIKAIRSYKNPVENLGLPSAPDPFLTYYEEDDRPQTALDRNLGSGMGIAIGRLRPDPVLNWKCVALSHNTLRGAAGGGVLMAELLVQKGYINI